jgi:hypothetical protein
MGALAVVGAAVVLVLVLRPSTPSPAAVVNGVKISQTQLNQDLADISANAQFVQQVDQAGSPGPVAGTKRGTYNTAFVAAVLDQQVQVEIVRQELAAHKALPTAAQMTSAKTEAPQEYQSGTFTAFPVRYQNVLIGQVADSDAFVNLETAHVTSAQLSQYYQAHVNDYATEACVRHILIADKDTNGQIDYPTSLVDAKKIKAMLDAGGDFATLAMKYSQDNGTTGSAAHGGMITGNATDGCLTTSDLQTIASNLPAFAESVVTLAPNQVSDPVQDQLGYDLIEVTKRVVEPLDATVTADIHQRVAGQKLTALETAAHVTVNSKLGSFDRSLDASGNIIGVVAPPGSETTTTTTVSPAGG